MEKKFFLANLFVDGSTQLGNQSQLVLLSVALQRNIDWQPNLSQNKDLHYGTPGPHLCHDTSCTPHVDRWAVVALSKQQLWRAVPKCHHSVGVPVWLVLLVDRNGSSKTKVGQLEDSLLGDQDVGSLHVPVDDLVGVDEVESLEHLLHHLLDLLQGELDIEVGQESGQIVLTEVKDQVEGGLVPVVCSADLDQVHNVVVVQQLENPYLP